MLGQPNSHFRVNKIAILLVAMLGVGIFGGCLDLALADIPVANTTRVLPDNISGGMSGYINATGSYSSSVEGLGAGGNPAIFNPPSTWNYGSAVATISPLMHIKNTPVDTTVRHFTTSGIIGTEGRPSFVGTLSGNSITGDSYTDTTFRANNITWESGTKAVSGDDFATYIHSSGYDGNKLIDPTDEGAVANINDWNSAIDHNTYITREDWSNLATAGWEQYADMTIDIPFTFNFEPVGLGSYTFSWGLHARKFGCEKRWTPWFSGQVLTSYDTDTSSGNTYDKEGAWCFISLEYPGAGEGVYRPYYEGSGLSLYAYSFSSGTFYTDWTGTEKTVSLNTLSNFMDASGGTMLRLKFYNHVYNNYNWEQVFTYGSLYSAYLAMRYAGNNFPLSRMVTINSRLSGPITSYEEWAFPGVTNANTEWSVSINPESRALLSSFGFDIFRIAATKYYDAYYVDEILAFEPSIRTGIILAGTPAIPFVVDGAGGGHIATAKIPSLNSFSGYNKPTGTLTFQVSIPGSTWDYLTYTLNLAYNLSIPFIVPFSGGTGSITISIPKLTAFSLECTQAQVPNATYISQVLVEGISHEVYHTFNCFNGTTPLYNSSWPLPYSQVKDADATSFTMIISTDSTAPNLLSWEIPPVGLGGYAIIEETDSMHFHLMYEESAPWEVVLAWTNGTEGTVTGQIIIPIETGFVDILASAFSYGNYHFWMYCRDKAGNVNATPSRWIIIVTEQQPPVCEIINPEPGISFATAPSIVANVVDQNLDNSTIYLHTTRSGQTFKMAPMYGGGSGFYVLDNTHGDWLGWTSNFTTFSEGWVNFWVSATDTRGNTGQSEPADFWALVDRHNPTLNLIGPANGTAWATPPVFSVSANDALSSVSISYIVNDGTYTSDLVSVIEDQAPPVSASWPLSTSIFQHIHEGLFEAAVLATDATGSNYALGLYRLRKDTTAPYVLISGITVDQLFGANPPRINFTVSDDTALECEIRVILSGHIRTVIPVPSSAGTLIGGNSTAFSYLVPASLWTSITWEGDAVLEIVANDSLEQLGSRSIAVRIDTIAPRVTIISPTDGAFIESLPPITVSGFDANYLIAWYSLDGGQTRYPITGLPGTTNFLCDQGAWLDAYAENVNLIVAIEDAAGNVGFAKITLKRGDFLKYGPGPNPWIFFAIFEQAWPVQVLFWAPVVINAMYSIIVRRRNKTTAPPREVAL